MYTGTRARVCAPSAARCGAKSRAWPLHKWLRRDHQDRVFTAHSDTVQAIRTCVRGAGTRLGAVWTAPGSRGARYRATAGRNAVQGYRLPKIAPALSDERLSAPPWRNARVKQARFAGPPIATSKQAMLFL